MKTRFGLLLIAGAALPVLAQSGMDPKGIYLDSGDNARPAMKFNVLLDRNGEQKTVSTNYKFHEGDRMKFRFELNRDSYIYVLHRTVSGDSDTVDRYAGQRGIEVIRDEDRQGRQQGSYELLFPNGSSGKTNLVRAHQLKAIPVSDGSWFRMDDQPGMEKLLVVVSRKPIEISKYFDVSTGRIRKSNNSGAESSDRHPKNDSDDDVASQLTRDLIDFSGNTAVQGEKGIDVVDDYASANSGSKPMVVPIDLRHLPNR